MIDLLLRLVDSRAVIWIDETLERMAACFVPNPEGK